MNAQNLSAQNKYVKCVRLNGEPLDGFILSHEAILAGGLLEFEMTDAPGQRNCNPIVINH